MKRAAGHLAILAFALNLGAADSRADSSSVAADPGRAIDAYLQPLVDQGHVSDQLLVTRNGATVVERSYGVAGGVKFFN